MPVVLLPPQEEATSMTLWLPRDMSRISTSSVTVPRLRSWLVGVCKCGHAWMMHYHHQGIRPGTSCDEWNCKCKRYRLRRVRRIGPRR